MSTLAKWTRGLTLLVAAVAAGVWAVPRGAVVDPTAGADPDVETVTRTDYHRPEPKPDDRIADDRIEEKTTAFDPGLVDPRPLGGWMVNASDAVIRLDTPMLLPDRDAELLRLRPSYKAAAEAARASCPGETLLPSVSMIDGKAKQVDDGLFAAIDLAYYKGLDKALTGHVALVRRLFDKVDPKGPAAPYLAAGLALAGVDVPVLDEPARDAWLANFHVDRAQSRPTGFYTWSKPLSDCFRFLRFFQWPIPRGEGSAAIEIAAVLKADPALLADVKKAIAFYARLTNPTREPTLADLAEGKVKDSEGPGAVEPGISLFPNATSRETELFSRLFPTGLPPDADLMKTMIAAIRSGSVSLRPGPDSGWYDYQVFALETLLLPVGGDEKDKLLLTRAYKERMLDAFKAMMTKRRETHARAVKTAMAGSAPPPEPEVVRPRLRLEPCPTYYLRTARAYGFLAAFLESAVGASALETLHGLREGGERPLDLRAELGSTRELFYGFYLLSAEDIGLAPKFLDGEPVDRARSLKAASDWLARPFDDPDMAVDTRVSVPIYLDPMRQGGATRIWATIGVRLARLEAGYVRGPRTKPEDGPGDWKEVAPSDRGTAHYLIAVDEFAEAELRGLRTITRDELRAICDAETTKEGIVKALGSAP